jgi:branched-chain amino acid transport system ATP-binding protein
VLKINNLVTSYGMIEALKGATLEVPRGKITVLLGPNGAGKTTMMFTIAGILKAKSGSILFKDLDLVNVPSAEIVRQGVVLVPENRLVFPDMDVLDNLRAGAYLHIARDKAGVARDIKKLFQRFPALERCKQQLAGTLSGGEQQMLAIARAMMARPQILLMDEPSVGLAPLIVDEIFAIVKALNREGITIFLVEQNAHKALEVADQFYLLEQGRVTFKGIPGEMDEDEVIRRAYLGSSHAGH